MQVGENPDKVRNIVDTNVGAFQQLYAEQLASVQLQRAGEMVVASKDNGDVHGESAWLQDTSPQSRVELLSKLPPQVVRQIVRQAGVALTSDMAANMPPQELASRPELVECSPSRLQAAVRHTIGGIVAQSAWRQSAKGLLTAGVGKVLTYLYQKWQTGRATRRRARQARKTS
eukprot:SAG31_NODE_3759_length_3909_cov_2.636220_5_plen_173_part_00